MIFIIIFSSLILLINGDKKELKRIQSQAAQKLLDETLQDVNVGVFVIDSASEQRKKHVRSFLSSVGLANRATYYPQVDKFLFLKPNYAKKLVDNGQIDKVMSTRRAAAGIFGCSFSHKKVLDGFLKSNHEVAILFEDDVVPSINSSIAETQINLSKQLRIPRREWNIQYIGFCFELCVKCVDDCHRCINLERFNGARGTIYAPAMRPLCTHALVFDRVTATILVNNFFPIHDAYDNYITDTACRFDLKAIMELRQDTPILY